LAATVTSTKQAAATRATERRLRPGLAAPLRAAMPKRVRRRAGRGRRSQRERAAKPEISIEAPAPKARAGEDDSPDKTM
jgi:hypothetical protein